MESSLWSRLIAFARHSLTEKFKAFFPGCIMGFIGSQHLLWAGVPDHVVSFFWGAIVIGVKSMGTLLMAFGSGLATSYASKLVDQHFEKKSKSSIDGVKKRKAT